MSSNAPINVSELTRLAQHLEAARKQHATAKRLADAINLKALNVEVDVQVSIYVRGGDREYLHFPLVKLPKDGFGQAQPVERNSDLARLMQQHARDHLIACTSAVEGLEFQIRRLTRA